MRIFAPTPMLLRSRVQGASKTVAPTNAALGRLMRQANQQKQLAVLPAGSAVRPSVNLRPRAVASTSASSRWAAAAALTAAAAQKPQTASEVIKEGWGKGEYLKGMLDTARDVRESPRDTEAHVQARSKAHAFMHLMSTDKAFAKRMHEATRTKARRMPGARWGTGDHELLPTHMLAEFFKRSAGMSPGHKPISVVSGKGTTPFSFDWLQAHMSLRMPTHAVLFPGGGGHTGALKKELAGTGFMTTGQPGYHGGLSADVMSATTPLSAAQAALKYHLANTPTRVQLAKSHQQGFDVRGRDLRNSAQRQGFLDDQAHYRRVVEVGAGQMKSLKETLRSTTALTPLPSKVPLPDFTGSFTPKPEGKAARKK